MVTDEVKEVIGIRLYCFVSHIILDFVIKAWGTTDSFEQKIQYYLDFTKLFTLKEVTS